MIRASKTTKWIFLCALLLLSAAVFQCPSGNKSPKPLTEVTGVWRVAVTGVLGELIVIHLAEDPKVLKLEDRIIPVIIESVDEKNNTITFTVKSPEGKNLIWTLRQVWNEQHDQLHLLLTLDTGWQSELNFVRQITNAELDELKTQFANAANTSSSAPIRTQGTPTTQTNTNLPAASSPASSPARTSTPEDLGGNQEPPMDCSNPVTDSDLKACAMRDFGAADRKINAVYKNVMSQLPPGQKDILKQEQKNWIKIKESRCAMEADEAGSKGSSAWTLSNLECLTRMTKSRTQELKKYAP